MHVVFLLAWFRGAGKAPFTTSADRGMLVSQTMTAFRDVRASARKAAVTALLKGIADYPAGPTAPWMVDALVGRMEDDSGETPDALHTSYIPHSEQRSRFAPHVRRWLFAPIRISARRGENVIPCADIFLSDVHLMNDLAACVREAAVRGLVKVSERGNEAVVIAMAYLIEEETAVTVKKAAVRPLVFPFTHLRFFFLPSFSQSLEKLTSSLSCVQLQALPRLANRGDEKALAPVMKLLECVQGHERGDIFCPHVSRMLSKHAVKALGTLAGRGNEEVLKVLHGRILDDPEPSVREAAARSIGNLADADDARSVAALYLCMEDEDEVVRRTAMRSTRTMLRRQREDRVRSGGAEEPEDEPECGASRLWLLPGMWGG